MSARRRWGRSAAPRSPPTRRCCRMRAGRRKPSSSPRTPSASAPRSSPGTGDRTSPTTPRSRSSASWAPTGSHTPTSRARSR
jgi:hypothetical protein